MSYADQELLQLIQQGKKIEAESVEEGDVLIELDGEQLGRLPATFEILPQRIPIIGYV